VVRNTSAALSQLDDSLEEAARNLGASWISAFRMVVLPIIMPGVMSGILLAFVSACGEFTSSFMLYIFSNKPISVEMAAQMDQFNLGQACAYGVLQIILIFIVTLLTNHIVKTEKITLGGVA
jgi:iron(III) transport system permease protein